MSKLVALSDTHGHQCEIPAGKYLVHVGDYQKGHMVYEDAKAECRRHLRWLREQPHQFKIQLPGNHDDLYWYQPLEFIELCLAHGVQPLCTLPNQEGYVLLNVGKLRFSGTQHGYPHSRQQAVTHSELPASDCYDVLLTHAPPYGIFDFEPRKQENCGSVFLRNEVVSKKPRLHLFGHIHDQYGKTGPFCNVALCDNNGKLRKEPMVIDVTHLELK